MSRHGFWGPRRTVWRARLLVPVLLVLGCNSLGKLFPSNASSNSADASANLPDASAGSLPVGTDAPLSSDVLAGIDSALAASSVDPPQPSLIVESPAILAVVTAMTAALASGTLDAAAAQFAPEVRDRYAAMFASAPPEKMNALAAALAQVNLTTVVLASVNRADQRAEGTVTYEGRVFHVGFVKHAGAWLIASL